MKDAVPSPEPADESEAGLPVHRWVFRALVLGAVGGLFSSVTMFMGAVMRRGGIPDRLSYGLLLFAVIGLTWCALLAFSEQLVRRRAPWQRPLLLALVGALSALAAASAFTGVESMFDHADPARAWRDLVEFYGDEIFSGRKFGENLLIGLGTLLPFAGIGAARLGFTASGPWPLKLQLPVALVTGAISTLLFSGLNGNILSPWGFTTFCGGATLACLGMFLGERVERTLLAKIKRAVDPPD